MPSVQKPPCSMNHHIIDGARMKLVDEQTPCAHAPHYPLEHHAKTNNNIWSHPGQHEYVIRGIAHCSPVIQFPPFPVRTS